MLTPVSTRPAIYSLLPAEQMKIWKMCIRDRAYIMNRLLKGVLYDQGGTARGLYADDAGMESVGKTGTTNDNRDVWFVGLTPYYCSAFWFGYDENIPMTQYLSLVHI